MNDRPFHHTATGFRNNHPEGWRRGSFWQWQRDRWRQGVPQTPAGGWQFPRDIPNSGWLRANRSEPTITWLGNLLLDMAPSNGGALPVSGLN